MHCGILIPVSPEETSWSFLDFWLGMLKDLPKIATAEVVFQGWVLVEVECYESSSILNQVLIQVV